MAARQRLVLAIIVFTLVSLIPGIAMSQDGLEDVLNRHVPLVTAEARDGRGVLTGVDSRRAFEQLVEGRSPRQRVVVKGIYVSGYMAGTAFIDNYVLKLTRETELNAVVIDSKGDEGKLHYLSSVPLVQQYDAHVAHIPNPEALLDKLRAAGVYIIARHVVFKDSALAEARPDLVLRRKDDGGIWRDSTGAAWINAFSREVWEYNVAIAKEAARLGFDEIQFDYVRFPSDGDLGNIAWDVPYTKAARVEAITGFLAYARQELKEYDVFLSADVFGLTTSADEMGIGQDFDEVIKHLDYISPMVYPSHYWTGSYGAERPNAEPYHIVYTGLTWAVRRMNRTQGHTCELRPWLQDFSWGPPPYGPTEVRAQIQATYDAGADSWLLWNPRNEYTTGALLRR